MEQTTLRDWSSYNLAQTREGKLFIQLLRELVDQVQLKQLKKGRGRPFSYAPDMLFCCSLKLYSNVSTRRIISQLEAAKELGYIKSVPHFNTISNYLNRKELTGILRELLTLSSLPLKSIEKKFAVDATGFSTRQYHQWFNPKVGYHTKFHTFLKAHIMSGTLTNTITSLEVTIGSGADSPEFPRLVSNTAQHFDLEQVSADKAYSSRANLELVYHHGAIPYIPFKKNASRKARGSLTWSRCLALFQDQPEEFYKHYHLRSNVESTFSALKRKFGAKLYMKNFNAQVNEIYIKCICYNITVLIRFLFEMNVDIDFDKCAKSFPAQHLAI